MAEKPWKYRKYDREFKVNAAKLVNERGMSETQVAKFYRNWISLIGKWATAFAGQPQEALSRR